MLAQSLALSVTTEFAIKETVFLYFFQPKAFLDQRGTV